MNILLTLLFSLAQVCQCYIDSTGQTICACPEALSNEAAIAQMEAAPPTPPVDMEMPWYTRPISAEEYAQLYYEMTGQLTPGVNTPVEVVEPRTVEAPPVVEVVKPVKPVGWDAWIVAEMAGVE